MLANPESIISRTSWNNSSSCALSASRQNPLPSCPGKVGEGEDQYELRARVLKDLESAKWYLWYGNVFQALNELQGLEMDVEGAAFETKDETARKLLKGIEELHYLRGSQSGIHTELRRALSQ